MILRKEAEEGAIEGEELKKLAIQHEIEKKKLEDIRTEEARQLMTDNLRQIEDVKRTRDVQRRQEEVRTWVYLPIIIIYFLPIGDTYFFQILIKNFKPSTLLK